MSISFKSSSGEDWSSRHGRFRVVKRVHVVWNFGFEYGYTTLNKIKAFEKVSFRPQGLRKDVRDRVYVYSIAPGSRRNYLKLIAC